MLFENNLIYGGDDCYTVGSPSRDIYIGEGYCGGGHGFSVGPLGKGGASFDVQNVLYVIHILVGSGSLTSCSKDRNRCRGKPQFGRRF
jgi:hypothetical protein